MSFIGKELKQSKISLFIDKNQKIYHCHLYNMGKIVVFSEKAIFFTTYKIEGENLKIVKVEENEIEIEGTIFQITYQEESNKEET